jgi:hypothetical protein
VVDNAGRAAVFLIRGDTTYSLGEGKNSLYSRSGGPTGFLWSIEVFGAFEPRPGSWSVRVSGGLIG